MIEAEQHVEAPHSSYLLCQDTYFVGVIKGVGQIDLRSVVDAHCSLASASRSPETNCFCERFHRTLKEEFFMTVFRQKLYASVEELQTDQDAYLEFYNRSRCHQGYRTKGRTPYQAFLDGRALLPQERVA